MANLPDPLANVRIATPCPTSWASMAGDEKVRHCTLCSLNVYNFAEMTSDEVQSLLLRTEGRLCARIYRRSDGTVITRDCPTGLRALRRRVSRAAGAVLSALLALTGCASRNGASCEKRSTEVEIESTETAMTSGALAGVVSDPSGNPLPGVTVALRDETSGRVDTAVTDMDGRFLIPVPKSSIYTVDVELAGALPARKARLALDTTRVTRVRASLEFALLGETITVGGAGPMVSNLNTEQVTALSGQQLRSLTP